MNVTTSSAPARRIRIIGTVAVALGAIMTLLTAALAVATVVAPDIISGQPPEFYQALPLGIIANFLIFPLMVVAGLKLRQISSDAPNALRTASIGRLLFAAACMGDILMNLLLFEGTMLAIPYLVMLIGLSLSFNQLRATRPPAAS